MSVSVCICVIPLATLHEGVAAGTRMDIEFARVSTGPKLGGGGNRLISKSLVATQLSHKQVLTTVEVAFLRLYAVRCRKPQPARGTRCGLPPTGLHPPIPVTRHAAEKLDAIDMYEHRMMEMDARSLDAVRRASECCFTGDSRGRCHTLRQEDPIMVKKLAEIGGRETNPRGLVRHGSLAASASAPVISKRAFSGDKHDMQVQ